MGDMIPFIWDELERHLPSRYAGRRRIINWIMFAIFILILIGIVCGLLIGILDNDRIRLFQ